MAKPAASSRLALVMRCGFVVALVVAMVMAVLPQPPQLPTDDLGDKFHHILAFVVLAGLASGGWPSASPWRVIERLSFLGAIIEVVQAIPALHRDCDIRDWVADTVAVAAVAAVVALWRRATTARRRQ